MLWSEYVDNLKNAIELLSFKSKVSFGFLICQKMIPNYQVFSENASFGNIEHMYKILEIVDQVAIKGEFDVFEINNLQNDLLENFPDLDEELHPLASYGLDVCVSFDYLLEFMKSKDNEHLVNVASSAYNTVDMYVQEKNNLDPVDPKLENKISNDYFLKKEVDRQFSILKKLQAEDLNPRLYKELKLENDNSGRMLDFDLLSN